MWKFIEKQKKILASETNALAKHWGGKLSVVLVYPNVYSVGMGNLAIHALYKILNDHPNVVCERAFLPDKNDMAESLRTNTPVLSIETQKPLSEFDCVAFSISFQNDFLNIIPILSLCSIPHRSNNRGGDYPLLLAGGAAVTINPYPVSQIFDCLALGEGEEVFSEIVSVLCEETDKKQRLQLLSEINGLLVPSLTTGDVKKRFIKDLDKWRTETVVYSNNAEFGDMHLIEMSRGCPRKCRFCATPSLYSPFRVRSKKAISQMLQDGEKFRNKIGLIGADLLSHKTLIDIIEEIHEMGKTFSPSSLRVDGIDNKIASLLAKSGHKAVSLGIEGASISLRSSIGKDFSDDQIISAVSILAENKISFVRLYFMIGLPGETLADIEGIVDLVLKIKTEMKKQKKMAISISVTITPFVPKPDTFFCKEKFAEEGYLRKAVKILKRSLSDKKGISIHHDTILSSQTDYILSNRGTDLITFLENIYETGSIRKEVSKFGL